MMLFLRIIISMRFCLALLAAPLSYLQAEQTDMRLPVLFEKLNATLKGNKVIAVRFGPFGQNIGMTLSLGTKNECR